MANEIQETILKGVLSEDRTRYFYLVEKSKDEYFSDEYRDLWAITQRVYDVAREIVDYKTLEKVLSRSNLPVDRITKVELLWHRMADRAEVSDADFKTSIDLLVKDYQTVRLGEALTSSLEILARGITDEKTKEFRQGPDAALEYFRNQLGVMDSLNTEVLPEFNIRAQKLELLAELNEFNTMDRLPTGIRPFDDMTNGGIARGEMVLIVAGTGVGKSITCTSVAHNVMLQGENVIYFTTETLFTQIRHRILVKHTREPQFGLAKGLSSTLIKKHSPVTPELSEEEVEVYRLAVEDFTENENYGQLIVVQIPKNTPMSTLEAKLYRWHQEYEIGLCIIDSPDMLSPDHRYAEERHNLNDIVNATKGLAISFDNGRGLRILAPWQSSRAGQKEARDSGRYTKDCLSDTQMAEKRADIILALLEDPDSPYKLKGQTLKCRDSAPHDFELTAELDHYYIGSEESLESSDSGINVHALM